MNRVRVYGFDDCPFCKQLMEIFEKDNIDYVYVNIDLDENQEETNKIMKIGKTDSVPIVLVNNTLLSPDVSFTSITEAHKLTKKFLL